MCGLTQLDCNSLFSELRFPFVKRLNLNLSDSKEVEIEVVTVEEGGKPKVVHVAVPSWNYHAYVNENLGVE